MTDIPTQYSNRDCGHIHQSLEIKKNKLVNLDLCYLFHLFHKLIRVIGYTIAPFNFEQISVFSDTRWNRVYPGSYPGRSRFNIEYASVEFPVCESKSHFSKFSSSPPTHPLSFKEYKKKKRMQSHRPLLLED